MKVRLFLSLLGVGILPWLTLAAGTSAAELDKILQRENEQKKVALKPAPLVDDLAYLRRVSVDLIGRIPAPARAERHDAVAGDIGQEPDGAGRERYREPARARCQAVVGHRS